MIVTPTNKSVTALEGLHLFHADISNCSMRVRMVLAEKELPWTSHHLDLRKKETVTPEYFGIHPKGLVPTLVHNGVVHIESNEIIEYLDETYPDPPLQPRSGKERDVMHEWLRTATEIHVPAVKTLIYTRKIGKVLHKNEAEDAKYRSLQRDPELLAFHSRASTGVGLPREQVDRAEAMLLRLFGKAEEELLRHEWKQLQRIAALYGGDVVGREFELLQGIGHLQRGKERLVGAIKKPRVGNELS